MCKVIDWRRAPYVLAMLLAMTPLTFADELTVIELHHRQAEDLLPVLKPLAGPNVALSGIEYKLLARGNAVDLARLREAVAVLDRAQRQLLLSVRYGSSPQTSTNDMRVTGAVGNRGSQLALRGVDKTQTVEDTDISSVRVLEGNRAFIASGQNVPVITAVAVPSATGPVIAGVTTDYRELSSGFSVLPRVNGSQVILEISSQQQRPINNNSSGQNNGSATVARVTTTVAGQIGEWLVIGGMESSAIETSSGIGSRRIATQSDRRTIAIKVEALEQR